MLNQNRWGKALAEILDVSAIRAATLASEAGLSGAAISYFCSGKKRPSGDTAASLNSTLAAILHEPNIASYLDAVYWLDRTEDSEGLEIPKGAWDAFFDSLHLAFPYFKPGSGREIVFRLKQMTESDLRRLVIAMSAVFRRRLVRHILGDADPAKNRLDELRDVFGRHGLDVSKWLLPKAEIADQLEEDEFVRACRSALKIIPEPASRFAVEGEILSAFYKFNKAQLLRDRLLLKKLAKPKEDQ